jgi:hypothetical protein
MSSHNVDISAIDFDNLTPDPRFNVLAKVLSDTYFQHWYEYAGNRLIPIPRRRYVGNMLKSYADEYEREETIDEGVLLIWYQYIDKFVADYF